MENTSRAGLDDRDATGHVQGAGAVAAFFDMDNTLLSAASGRLYLRWLRQTGRLPLSVWASISVQVLLYLSGILDFPRLMSRLTVYAGNSTEIEAWRMSAEWFEASLRHAIAAGGREQIERHRALGHHVAIVSAATPYAVKPISYALGIGDAFLATELEVVGGRFTGKVIQPACYGYGKVVRVRAYAATHNLDLRSSYFYSDSSSDIPLLEAVGNPVAVNPRRRLRRIAMERDWPIMRFY